MDVITIVGRAGRDPEMRFLPKGDPVTDISVAVDGWQQGKKITKWFRVAFFGPNAERMNEYVKKGALIAVVGTLRADLETGGPVIFERKDGTSGAAFELMGQTWSFVGGKKKDDDSEEE